MPNQVAWTGQDGNLYWRQGDQVINAGPATSYQFTQGGLRALDPNSALGQGAGFAPGVDQIADPNVKVAAPTGGTAVTKPVLNQGAVNNTQASIDQIAPLLQAALASEDTSYGNTVNGFNAQEGTQRKTYEGSTVTNQNNYDSNFMDSIRAGIKGLGGLMALLRGTGASGGSVDDNVRDTVGGVTANDIRGGADTQKENQGALDASLSSFLTDLGTKRKANEDTHVNNERAITRDSNTQLQDLYGKMAGYYGDAQLQPQADDFMARAGALTAPIAANSKTQVSPYDTTPVAVQAPQLTAFAGPTQPNVLAAPQDGQVGSGIFTMTRNKKTAPEPTPALAGV